MEPKLYWERKDVTICYCYNSSGHVHCPCSDCDYSAVNASTEYRHWKKFTAIYVSSDTGENTNIMDQEMLNENFESGDSDGESNSNENGDSDGIEDNESDSNEDGESDGNEDGESDGNEDGDERNLNINNNYLETVISHVTRTLEFCMKTKISINHTEEMLNYVGELLALTGPSIKEFWPTSYYTAVSLLNECGKPVETKICFNCQHPLHWYALSKTENCPSCETDPQLMRYYLPLKTKLKLWFSSPEMCFDMLAHWRSKDVWFNSDGPTFPLKELWDGSRFKQLKWFWDPNCSWPLPHKCKECKQFINLLETNVVIGMPFDLTCADCGTQDQIIASFVKGDPRNIGLIGHFDGWQPGFGKVANHSSGSIEVSIANMDKRTRNKAGNVFVTSFVPEHMLPKKQPMALDPYLEPLVSELEDLFLNGMEVDYPINVDEHVTSGKVKIRCMLLLWTGDYPAQCQVGKFLCKGTFGCRVDKCKGESLQRGSSTKYYTNNRFRYRWPWERRNLVEEISVMGNVEGQYNLSAKQRMASATGYTGLSLLCRLYTLYGFDPTLDLVHDVMHVVPLNCCKKLFSRYIEDENVNIKDLNQKLENFPFTREMKNGHYPKNILRYKSWTAEDWKKFAFPAAELIFADVMEDQEYELIWLTARMVQMLFHFRDGLSFQELEVLKKICWRRLILLEEDVGAEQCVITCHNTLHIVEDIIRFGHCDNFWCFHNERAVQRYKRTLTNFKNIEYTYSKMEMRREVFAVMQKNRPTRFKVDENHLLSSSYQGALQLYDVLKGDLSTQAETDGIFIGAFLSKNANTLEVDDLIITSGSNAQTYQQFRCCAFPGRQEIIKYNDNVVFSDGENDLIGKVLEIIYTQVGEKFIRLKLFRQANEVLEGTLSNFNVVCRTEEEIVKRSCKIKRKIILVEIEDSRFICVDINSSCKNAEILVPVYPSVNDMVIIKNDADTLALIKEVLEESHQCVVKYYSLTTEKNVFEPFQEGSCHWNDIASLVEGKFIDGFFIRF